MFRTGTASALLAATALAAPLAAQDVLGDAEIVPLTEWAYDDLYAGGVSADNFIDDMEVYGPTGDDIGDVEDIVIGPDGRILSIVAEVGGFWDIGDTHVSVPYEQVEMSAQGDGIVVPVTEDTVGDYDVYDPEMFAADTLAEESVAGLDDAIIARAWRASELIGDYARLRTDEEGAFANYGYVNDLILSDGEVSAVIVQPSAAYGGGYVGYPYYGYGTGWAAGSPYYDMPYTAEDIEAVEPFEYDRLGS